VSSKFLSASSVNHKRERKRGDPALLDRLNRAMGAYQMRTGKRVESQDLAKAAGLGSSTMTDITTLDRKVTIADAVAFADYLGVEFAWLAAGRGPMYVGEQDGNGGVERPARPPAQPSDPSTTPLLADTRAELRRRKRQG
jgi:hypothetical protein